jgi:MtN3 and saliva related transmembrane protein
MKQLIVEIIGYLAAAGGTFLMIPQLYKSIKTKSVADISTTMFVVYSINCILWTIYGVFLASVPIIFCNAIAFFIGLAQLYIKAKYKNIVK